MRALRTVILAGVAAAALAVSTGAALADPPSGTIPATTDLVATGSDTIQFLADQLSKDYNATAPASKFYSFDAVNPATGAVGDPIETKNDANCKNIARPNGSGGGIKQLEAKIKTTDGHYCVDLARSSRQITAADGNGIASDLIAKDSITWSTNSGGNAVSNLTDAELQAIYECDATKLPTGDTTHTGPVKWSDLKLEGGTSTDPIVPVLPQSNSGTRSTWLGDLGNVTLGSCVQNGTYNGANIEENEGTNAVFTSAGNPSGYKDIVFPFSTGDYVCQVYTKFCPDQHGSLVLENIDGKAPLTTGNRISLSFAATYIRGLYFVVPNAGSNTTANPPALMNGTNNTAYTLDQTKFLNWVCSTAGKTDVSNYGFATVLNCGLLFAAAPGPWS